MKRYKFNLQRLLDIREQQEEESKIKFKEAKTDKDRSENKLNKLYENYNKFASRTGEGTTTDKKLTFLYLQGLSRNIQDTKKELIYKNKILEERRTELKEKKIKNKTVGILKEKDYDRYEKMEKLMEQKENDEFGISGFVRNKKEVNN